MPPAKRGGRSEGTDSRGEIDSCRQKQNEPELRTVTYRERGVLHDHSSVQRMTRDEIVVAAKNSEITERLWNLRTSPCVVAAPSSSPASGPQHDRNQRVLRVICKSDSTTQGPKANPGGLLKTTKISMVEVS